MQESWCDLHNYSYLVSWLLHVFVPVVWMHGQSHHSSPHCNSPGNRVIAMNDGVDASEKLIHTCDFVQVLLCYLQYFQDVKAKKIYTASTKGYVMKYLVQVGEGKTFQITPVIYFGPPVHYQYIHADGGLIKVYFSVLDSYTCQDESPTIIDTL